MAKYFQLPKVQYKYCKRDERNFDVEDFLSHLIKLTSTFKIVNNETPTDISFKQFVLHFEGIINKYASLRLLTRKEQQLKHSL